MIHFILQWIETHWYHCFSAMNQREGQLIIFASVLLLCLTVHSHNIRMLCMLSQLNVFMVTIFYILNGIIIGLEKIWLRIFDIRLALPIIMESYKIRFLVLTS